MRNARVLLRDALTELDAHATAVSEAQKCRGFADGARWMAARMAEHRGKATNIDPHHLATLGWIKYLLAVVAMVAWISGCIALHHSWFACFAPLVFYAVEAQMVFLFPVTITGSARPFRDARAVTVRAGGTLRVMATVLAIATFMLFGGIVGQGFTRAWAAGCLAIVLWYERLPSGDAEWFDPLDCFGLAPLRLRTEIVPATAAGSILLISDLHLGRPWNRKLPREILTLARTTRPTLILMAGDLLDRPTGQASLVRLLKRLKKVAPVGCVAGNHDSADLRHVVVDHGGHWLPEGPLVVAGIGVTSDPAMPPDAAIGVLCVHRPLDFEQAAGQGFTLLLAGHLHGGQCVLGRWKGRLLPAWWIHRWHVDRLERNGRTHIISRGAGYTWSMRWNCPREIVWVRLTPRSCD